MTQTERSACFRLTGEERGLLESSNKSFLEKVKAQQEVEDILTEAMSAEHYEMKFMSASEFIKAHNDLLHAYSATVIGKAL